MLNELNKEISKSATKTELKTEQNKILKLKAFDSSYFRGKTHFEEDSAQNYLVLQPMYRYFETIAGVCNGEFIYFWKSKRCLRNVLILLLHLITVLLQN